MKRTVKTLAVVLVGAGLVAFAAAPAVCADEFCPMGGTLIKAEVDKDKALEWGKDRRKAVDRGRGLRRLVGADAEHVATTTSRSS